MANALRDPPPSEVGLAFPPLALALVVARFSPVMKIADSSGAGIANFQDRIRRTYPSVRLEQEQGIQIQVDAAGNVATPLMVNQSVWRFFDKNELWRVSLTRDSIGLETKTGYTDRANFLARFADLCSAVRDAYAPAEASSVGVRYVNVLSGDMLERIEDFVRPEFLGFGHAPFAEDLLRSISHAQFVVPEGMMVIRWGVLPPNETHDPVVAAAPCRRWLVDIDASKEGSLDFSPKALEKTVRKLTERDYSVFRWVVTDRLLERCNGK